MRLKTVFTTLSILFALYLNGQSGFYVEGKVGVDQDIWESKVYLSIVESFEDLTTVAPSMIFADASLDRDGRFVIRGDFLPAGERLYRIHLRKLGDPLSTIIIGGKEHNHVHFAMAPGDSVQVVSSETVLGGAQVSGQGSNSCMQEANNKVNMRPFAGETAASLDLREEQIAMGLADIAESCPGELGSLYAAFILLQKFDDTEEVGRLPGILMSREFEETPYVAEVMAWNSMKFPQEIPDKSPDRTLLIGLIIALSATVFLGAVMFKDRVSKDLNSGENVTELIEQLSMQERRILQLMANGLSNKEISTELNIEVNTVKSHVSRIFKKLDIRSRKEAYRFVGNGQSGALTPG